MKSICGIECEKCELNKSCNGCIRTDGCPFGEKCMVAEYCQKGGGALDELKEKLIGAFNALGIPDMGKVNELHALRGSFINLELPLPSGQTVKVWNDNCIYLGNQLPKAGSCRCYGIAADEHTLMVCEYGENGTDAELVVLKRWN